MKCDLNFHQDIVNVSHAKQQPNNRPFPSASVSKRVFVQNLSYENNFDLHENEAVGGTHFIWIASHSDLFWHIGNRQLGNGLV